MRLKCDDESATRKAGAGARERGADFGRMMSVVVDDHDFVTIANDPATHVKRRSDAAEAADGFLERRKRDAQKVSDGQRRQCVLDVVRAGHRNFDGTKPFAVL